ncbi:hypothetical protein AAHE18_02G028800 [Arachis hypogaea]
MLFFYRSTRHIYLVLKNSCSSIQLSSPKYACIFKILDPFEVVVELEEIMMMIIILFYIPKIISFSLMCMCSLFTLLFLCKFISLCVVLSSATFFPEGGENENMGS